MCKTGTKAKKIISAKDFKPLRNFATAEKNNGVVI